MTQEKTFKTKTGFCHILPDKIILTKDGIIRNVSKVAIGNNLYKTLFIYGVITFCLFYFGFKAYQNGQTTQPIFFGLIGLYLIYGIITSLNNSATPVIYRKKIRDITFKKAINGLTRSRFEVKFEDENGKLKKRLIMLPGSITDGQNEAEKAIKIMKEELFIKTK